MWLLLAVGLWALLTALVLALLYSYGEANSERADGETVRPEG
jgi:hypothetical protein